MKNRAVTEVTFLLLPNGLSGIMPIGWGRVDLSSREDNANEDPELEKVRTLREK